MAPTAAPRVLECDESPSVQFSPDGRQLLAFEAGGDWSETRAWSPETGQALRPLPPCTGAAYSPDGAWLCLTSLEGALLRKVGSGRGRWLELPALGDGGVLAPPVFSPDSRRLLLPLDSTTRVSDEEGLAGLVLEVKSGALQSSLRFPVEEETRWILWAAFSSLDGSPTMLLGAGQSPEELLQWSGETLTAQPLEGTSTAFAMTPDAQLLASQRGKRIQVKASKGRTWRAVEEFPAPGGEVWALAFSAGAQHLVCLAQESAPGRKGSVRIWSLGARAGPALVERPGRVQCLAVGPTGSLVAAVTSPEPERYQLSLVALTSGRLLKEVPSGVGQSGGELSPRQALFSPDGRWLAVAYGWSVELWDVAQLLG